MDHGMKALCPKAGGVLIMPEALTHGALRHMGGTAIHYLSFAMAVP